MRWATTTTRRLRTTAVPRLQGATRQVPRPAQATTSALGTTERRALPPGRAPGRRGFSSVFAAPRRGSVLGGPGLLLFCYPHLFISASSRVVHCGYATGKG